MTEDLPQDVYIKDVLARASEELRELGVRLQAIELVFFSELGANIEPLQRSKLQDLDLIIQCLADLGRVLEWAAAAQPSSLAVATRPLNQKMKLADLMLRLLGAVNDKTPLGAARDATTLFDRS